VVVFASDVGSRERAVGDRHVAVRLRELGFGTLLVDLLASEESQAGVEAVDLDVLAVRLLVVTRWMRGHLAGSAGVAYFGVRSGAAVALLAAAEDPSISAVVVQGGRLEFVVPALKTVRAATLLVVGGADPAMRDDNARAASVLTCDRELIVVPGATDRFVEPGALETSARLAGAWFLRHLSRQPEETNSHEPPLEASGPTLLRRDPTTGVFRSPLGKGVTR
jgi:putative phosphoribosyl transferase